MDNPDNTQQTSDPGYQEYLDWKQAQAAKTDPAEVQITLHTCFVSYERNDTGGYTLRNYGKASTEASLDVTVLDNSNGTGDRIKWPAGNTPPEISAYQP